MQHVFALLICILLAYSCTSSKEQTKPRTSTAAANVEVLDTIFTIAKLNRERKIRVFVPADYETSGDTYPVLYMHDGQNLFDYATSYVGEWKVDETLNEQKSQLIVVGIDNGQDKRMNEMGPYDHPEFGKGEGKEYLDFIMKQVKPYIDEKYRTKPAREHTGMMGSSMGGLITHFALLQYPEFFNKAGIFSPSYWHSEAMFQATTGAEIPEDTKLYIIMGSKEGSMMTKPFNKMIESLKQNGHPEENLYHKNIKGGDHSEGFWASEFEAAVNWLFE